MAELRLVIDIPELEELMADVRELQTKVEAIAASVANAQTRTAEDFDNLRSLLAQADIDQDTLDQINATLDSVQSQVDSIDPDPAFPAPADTPPTDDGTTPPPTGDGGDVSNG